MQSLRKFIFYLFSAFLFFTPIILWPFTSEVFEFNKIILTYLFTALIVGSWACLMIFEGKIILRRTLLDIPLLVFLASQTISTLISIDPTTSWLGYYSRFNGGLLSSICYSLLYWAFVSNIEASDVLKLIKVLFSSAFLVSTYGVLEHFGIDKDVWVQDVKSRVFSTLGQPNWLASWLVAILPITWVLTLKAKDKFGWEFWSYFGLSVLFFWTLIFTKSRSGFLGLIVALSTFVVVYFLNKENQNKASANDFVKKGLIVAFSFFSICLISGTQWTPSIYQMLNSKNNPVTKQAVVGPALEVGGTESGVIRKIVWKGALDIWKNYPIFGTGVETFAYSYYKYRPQEHNLVSEWDFVYNKAHNQYLNIAANSGTFGIISYLLLIVLTFYLLTKTSFYAPALSAGYMSLLVTNFFGFSVVPTDILFFLFPAIAIAATKQTEQKTKSEKIVNSTQKIFATLVGLTVLYTVFLIGKYWMADLKYSKGKDYNSRKRPDLSVNFLNSAINLQPKQALYHNEISMAYTTLAQSEFRQKNSSSAAELTNLAISESQKATDLSPANINIKRNRFGMYVMLSSINPNYIVQAGQTLLETIKLAPTDAKLYYNLALFYIQVGRPNEADQTFKKTIEIKGNYKEARLAYAVFLIDKKNIKEAKSQLEYILTNIDPKDELTKQTLESIK